MFRIWVFTLLTVGLTACSDRTFAPVMPQAANIGETETVFVATTRAVDDTGFFGRKRSPQVDFLEVDVSIPPSHTPGRIAKPFRDPDPNAHFVLSRQDDLGSRDRFVASLKREIRRKPAGERDLLIYVHGYNNSFSDSVFRVAQLSHDFDVPGVPIAYSWPSDAHPLNYPHDRDSALFARDGLESLLRAAPASGANRIILVAHSMGSLLVMETLRQIEIAEPGWSKRHIDGVVLVSPDLDLDLFKQQVARIGDLPQPFTVFVSKRDRVLSLSAQINGQSQRLGQVTDAAVLADYPLTLLDVSEFAGGGLNPDHFTAGTSPALIALLTQGQGVQRVLQRDPSGRAGGLYSAVITVQKATQLVLSPDLLLKR